MKRDGALDAIESAMSEGALDNMHKSIVRVTYLRDGEFDMDGAGADFTQTAGDGKPSPTNAGGDNSDEDTPSLSSDDGGSSSSVIIGVVLGTMSVAIIALAVGGYAYRKREAERSEQDLNMMSDEQHLLSEEQSIGTEELNGEVLFMPPPSTPASHITASPIMSGTFD